jgi:hypothetical protein
LNVVARLLLLSCLLAALAGTVQVLRVLIDNDAVISITAFRIGSLDDLATTSMPQTPALVEAHITDMDVGIIADPFFWQDGDITHLFFEVVDKTTGDGVIALASGSIEAGFSYRGTVVQEPFHLSYPHVFAANGSMWMIPESWEAGAVRLYRADHFPDQWSFVGNLIEGKELVDPTPLHHDGRWWLLVSDRTNGRLDLYFSERLESGWRPHPQNPLIVNNPDVARPGGRIIEDNGRLYRVGQDAWPDYGLAVGLFEIVELTETAYREVSLARNPVLGASGKGWNADGMHHLDLQWLGDHWMGVADGHDSWKVLRGTPFTWGKSKASE